MIRGPVAPPLLRAADAGERSDPLALYRRWLKLARSSPRKVLSSASAREATGSASLLVAMASTFPLMILDSVFLPRSEGLLVTEAMPPSAPTWFVSLAAASILNVVLFEGVLAPLWQGRVAVPRGYRALLFLLAAVPLFGLYAISAWQVAAERVGTGLPPRPGLLPGPALRRSPVSPGRGWRSVVLGLLLRIGSRAALAAVLIFNLVALLAGARALAELTGRALVAREATICVAVALHLAAAAAMTTHLRCDDTRRRRGWGLSLGSSGLIAFWLVPAPGFPLLGLVSYLLLDVARPDLEEQALSRQAAGARFHTESLYRWLKFTSTVGDAWRKESWHRRIFWRPEELARPFEVSEVENRVTLLCRGKAILLFLEAGAFAQAMVALAERTESGLALTLNLALALSTILALGVGVLGLAGMALRFGRQLLGSGASRGSREDGFSFSAFLAGTYLAFFAGSCFGRFLWTGNVASAQGVLLAVGLVGAVVHTGPLLLTPFLAVSGEAPGQKRIRFVSTLGYVAIGTLGLGGAPSTSGLLSPGFTGWLWWAVPLGGVLGAAGRSWLRHPLLNRSASGTRAPPSPALRRLLTLSVILPLGSLALPFWVRWLSHRPRPAAG